MDSRDDTRVVNGFGNAAASAWKEQPGSDSTASAGRDCRLTSKQQAIWAGLRLARDAADASVLARPRVERVWESDAEQVQSAVKRYLQAAATGDHREFCELQTVEERDDGLGYQDRHDWSKAEATVANCAAAWARGTPVDAVDPVSGFGHGIEVVLILAGIGALAVLVATAP